MAALSTNKGPGASKPPGSQGGTVSMVTNNLNINSSAAEYLQNKQQGAATWQAAQNAALAAAQKAAAAKSNPTPTIPTPTTPVKTTTSIGGNGNQAPAGTVFNPNVPVNTPTPPPPPKPSSPSVTTSSGDGKGTGSGASTSTAPAPTSAGSSGGAAAFTPTGNVANDLATLKANGADNFTITQYMAQYGQGWNWNYLVTSDDKSAMGNAAKMLKDAGVTKAYQDANSGKATSYSFDDPNKPGAKVQIPSTLYNSATPQQQFALLQKYGVISSSAKLVVNNDGSWGYTGDTTSSNTVNGIPKDLYDSYVQNKALYAKYGHPAPFFVDNTQHAADGTGVVVVIPFDNPTKPLTVSTIANDHYRFKNVDGNAVINQIVNDTTGKVILAADAKGNFSNDDIANAIIGKTMSKNNAVILFGQDTVTTALQNAATMKIMDQPKYQAGKGQYYTQKALTDGVVTKSQLAAAGFQIPDVNTPAATVVIGTGTAAKGQITWSDFKKDPANKIPGNATFDHYDTKTGQVYYNVPASPVTASSDVLKEISGVLSGNKTQSGQVSALNDAIENSGLWNNKLLGKTVYLGGTLFYVDKKGNILTQQQQVQIQWNALTDDQKNQVAGQYSQDLYRTNPFAETTKQLAVAGSKGGLVGQLATGPLTGIAMPIAKGVTGQKVTPLEIAGGVATAVGDVLMVGGGEALVSGLGNAGKVITNSLVAGMGTLGIANTVIQAKQGNTSKGTLAVEAAISVAMLVGGTAGLVSSIVPKGTPDVDVAQQFINKMATQTTPEGLAKNSPFQSPIGELTKPLPEADIATAAKQADLTASYKEWTQASVDYAQNYKNILDLQAKITDNNATLDAISKQSTMLPDEYTARLASDTASMAKTLAKLETDDPLLAKSLSDAESQFNTSIKGYASYLKDNNIYNGTEISEAIKNLPHGSADVIKTTIDQLQNGDNNPAAVAAQQAKVDALKTELETAKQSVHSISGTDKLTGIESELSEAQSKLALLKVGNLEQVQSQLVNAREALSDVNEIVENGNIKNAAARQNLVTIQNTLENQIKELEDVVKEQTIKGKGLSDIIKAEYIKNAKGETIGARIYGTEGVYRYEVDDDGNILWDTKTEESEGGGNKVATETKPISGGGAGTSTESTATMTAEQLAELQRSSGWTFGVSPMIEAATPVRVSQPSSTPGKTPKEVPSTRSVPGVNPAPITRTVTPISPRVNPVTTTKTSTPTVTVNKPNSQTGQQNQNSNKSQSLSQTNTAQNNQIKTSQSQSTETETSTGPETMTSTMTSTTTPVVVKTATTPPPQSGYAGIEKPPEKGKEDNKFTPTAEDIKNATTWKAGFGWWLRFSNGVYRFYKKLPPGAQGVNPGKGSGYASVQTISGKPVVDQHRMGAVTVTINRPGKKPGAPGAISYHPTGQGRPGLSMTRQGAMVHIKGIGLANARRVPRGRIVRA